MNRRAILVMMGTFVVCMIGYSWYISSARPKTKAQNQWQSNRIAIEEFLLSKNNHSTVIVGSSMSHRISGSALPKDYANISLAAGSPLTGLELVKMRIDQVDDKVMTMKGHGDILVEMNFLHRPADETTLADTRMRLPIINRLPAMRTANQPVSILLGMLSNDAKADTSKVAANVPKAILEREVAAYNKPIDTGLWMQGMRATKKKLEELKKQVRPERIKLYLAPVHPAIRNTESYKYIRAQLKKYFPKSKYNWIEEYRSPTLLFTDGVHMQKSSAKEFGEYLKREVEKAE